MKNVCREILRAIHDGKLLSIEYKNKNAENSEYKLTPIDGSKQSIRAFLDADDLELLDDFDNNRERIKDRIIENNPNMSGGVDDNPYLMGLSVQMDIIIKIRIKTT